MQRISLNAKTEGKSIGLVPTMGFLHEGHLSLIRKSKKTTDITVVSIFVNPSQFAPNEDLSKYPRDFKRDKKLLAVENIDFIFHPSAEEMYPENYRTYVTVNDITAKLEGEFRPTHFKGVTTVVSMLFNAVKPDRAFFGQKDAQQAAVIRQMVRDLKFNIKIDVCPIIREPDGLALSSRNIFLSPLERQDALVLNRSLKLASKLIKEGEFETRKILKGMAKIINSVQCSNPDYISIVDAESFDKISKLKRGNNYYILIACKIGTTRLIDNIHIRVR